MKDKNVICLKNTPYLKQILDDIQSKLKMLEALSHYLETLILDYIVRHLYKIMAILHSFANKNIIMSSFKSSGDIQKKEGGPDSCFG